MGKRVRLAAGLGLSLVLGVGWSAGASAESFALDCRSSVPNLVIHIWVDSEAKSVTVQPVVNGQPQAPRTESGSGIQIDRLSVIWRDTTGPGNSAGEKIDRSAGTWTSQKYSGGDGLTQGVTPRVYTCGLGTTPLPATKF